ncbi:FliM/FliN family flagellar motor switch protein [Legionella sp. CNM-4043-24]|uniref:FliM/FliN family flagellar motor switch protein n=1 Tax=Legionella sp. CNM-4043-24 TaxID=3421646 RepID=UPI00403AA48C
MDDERIPPVEAEIVEGDDTSAQDSGVLTENDGGESFYFDNDVIENVISILTAEGQLKLSSFLRKKVVIKLNSISTCLFDEIQHDYKSKLMLNYRISPYEKYGLISYDFIFLHSVINLLYGGEITNNEPVMRGLGKSGIKIARKVSEILLTVLQDAMSEFLKIKVTVSESSSHLGTVFKQEKYDKCYNISLCAWFDSVVCNLDLILPERIFSHSDAEEVPDSAPAELRSLGHDDAPGQNSIFDEKARNELIDANVTVSVNLPGIALKLKDVVNLKAGDIIPIGDPTTVFVTLNDKKLYKASAGQSNLRRAVKITEKL